MCPRNQAPGSHPLHSLPWDTTWLVPIPAIVPGPTCNSCWLQLQLLTSTPRTSYCLLQLQLPADLPRQSLMWFALGHIVAHTSSSYSSNPDAACSWNFLWPSLATAIARLPKWPQPGLLPGLPTAWVGTSSTSNQPAKDTWHTQSTKRKLLHKATHSRLREVTLSPNS